MRLPGLSSILLHIFLAGFDKNSQSDDVNTTNTQTAVASPVFEIVEISPICALQFAYPQTCYGWTDLHEIEVSR